MPTYGAPIPGQSLTTEPRGFPWERPPEIVDPEEAIQMHLSKIAEPKRLRAALDLIELEGMDIATLVKGRLRGAVSQGMHSIDVSLIIAPVLHDFIKQAAAVAGIEAEDGFENKAAEEAYKKARIDGFSVKELAKTKPKQAVKEMEAEMEAMPEQTPRKGLMARGEK
jgi:hypothetical protein